MQSRRMAQELKQRFGQKYKPRADDIEMRSIEKKQQHGFCNPGSNINESKIPTNWVPMSQFP